MYSYVERRFGFFLQRTQGLPLLSGVPRRTTSAHRLRVDPVPLRRRRRLSRLGDRRPRHQDRVLHGEGRQEDRYLPPGGRPRARQVICTFALLTIFWMLGHPRWNLELHREL